MLSKLIQKKFEVVFQDIADAFQIRVTYIEIKKANNNNGYDFDDASADIGLREVRIPPPCTKYLIGVGAHELAHIILGHDLDTWTPEWLAEYEAERFTLEFLKQWGVETKLYINEAKGYVIHTIIKCHNEQIESGDKGIEIPKYVLEWCGFEDYPLFKGKKIKIQSKSWKNKDNKMKIVSAN